MNTMNYKPLFGKLMLRVKPEMRRGKSFDRGVKIIKEMVQIYGGDESLSLCSLSLSEGEENCPRPT